MFKFKGFKHSWILPLISISSLTGYITPALVQAQNPEELIPVIPDRRKPGGSRPASDAIEAPMRRKPGGSRDLLSNNSCRFDPQQLTALVPQSLSGATASASPTIFFAVPAIAKNTAIEFVIRDQKDKLVYEKTSPGLDQSGILSISLPPNTLNSSQDYHWYLSVICNNRDRAYDLVVEGFVQRVAGEFNQKQTANLEDKIHFYQTQNLWQDQLTFLAELKRDRPNDPFIVNLWQKTLKSVNLDENIATSSLLP